MDDIRSWIEAEGTGHYFFLAFPIVLLCLFVWFKGRRVRFLIPSLLISLVIINPLFYKKWNALGGYAYWRILWIVPVIPVLASLIPMATEKMGVFLNSKPVFSRFIKTAIVVISAVGILLGGSFVYETATGQFTGPAANDSKLPGDILKIADRLLELNEHPRIIAQDPVGVYIRQYTGEIDTLFGRDILGYMIYPSYDIKRIVNAVASGDWSKVHQKMLEDEFDYLVAKGDPGEEFDLVASIGEYGIYRAVGQSSVVKEKNELGQVISVTNIDDNGYPINNPEGYATITYEYDNYGNKIREFHYDINGNGVANSSGVAGYQREYDDYYRVIRETNLDIYGLPTSNIIGYTECRYTYSNDDIVRYMYYNQDGMPFVFQGGYSGIEQKWSGNTIVSRSYLDTSGNPVLRDEGYTKALWTQNEKGTWSIHFEDLENNELPIEGINLATDIKYGKDGWSEWMTPNFTVENNNFNIGSANLGEKEEGDSYTCQLEIEFKGVTSSDEEKFRIWAVGSVDGVWNIENIWSGSLIWMSTPPKDGVYAFTNTKQLSQEMANASTFKLSFRCDNWKSGSFRVRHIIVKKGKSAGEWSPGV